MTKTVLIGIPVLLIGGTEVQTLSVVKVLVSGGYRVAVCCYHEYLPEVVEKFRSAGAEVILLNLQRQTSLPGLLGIIPSLIKAFRSIKPDVVHVQYIAPGLLPIVAARLARVPVVFSTVHIAGDLIYGSKAKWMLRFASKISTAFICVSKDVEKFWFGTSQVFNPKDPIQQRKHFTIYNAVDAEHIARLAREADINQIKNRLKIQEKRVIGIVGRLVHQKGHAVLLDAMVNVINKFPDVILVILGDGPDRAKLEAQARNLRIESHIRWLGAVAQEDVFRMLSVMSIFVMPSLFEGFGLTAAEAMAAELPVVGSRVDGLAEVIEDGVTGYLVEPSDSSALTNALIKLLSNPEQAKEFGLRGQDRVMQYFSMGRFGESMLGFYKQRLDQTESH